MESAAPIEIIEQKLFLIQLLQFEVNKQISSVKLTQYEISIIQFLVNNSPDSLINIKTCVLEIIKDGKIDASDIPEFISLIKNIYTLFHTNNQIKINIVDIASTTGSIIKYVIHVLLDRFDLNSPELIKCCDSLIDTCVEMIELQSSLITKTCFLKLC